MIDEKKLIELLEEEILRIDTESTPGCGNLYGRDASVMKNTLNFVIDLINEQPKVGEWIPVEERLPKIGENVLVTCLYSNEVDFGYYCGDYWVLDYTDDEAYPVIAWMPLPEPYNKEV